MVSINYSSRQVGTILQCESSRVNCKPGAWLEKILWFSNVEPHRYRVTKVVYDLLLLLWPVKSSVNNFNSLYYYVGMCGHAGHRTLCLLDNFDH